MLDCAEIEHVVEIGARGEGVRSGGKWGFMYSYDGVLGLRGVVLSRPLANMTRDTCGVRRNGRLGQSGSFALPRFLLLIIRMAFGLRLLVLAGISATPVGWK